MKKPVTTFPAVLELGDILFIKNTLPQEPIIIPSGD